MANTKQEIIECFVKEKLQSEGKVSVRDIELYASRNSFMIKGKERYINPGSASRFARFLLKKGGIVKNPNNYHEYIFPEKQIEFNF